MKELLLALLLAQDPEKLIELQRDLAKGRTGPEACAAIVKNFQGTCSPEARAVVWRDAKGMGYVVSPL